MKRKVEIGETRVAGEGADGNTYGVTSVSTKGGNHVHRRKPCPTCPWRLDAEISRFPPEAYRHSAKTSYDGAFETFACHEAGANKPATCAGFILANGDNNIGLRLSMVLERIDFSDISTDVPLFPGYREMAIANGVPADDPALRLCRGNADVYDHEIRGFRALREGDDEE